MRLRNLRLLADENIDREVIAFLRGEGFDIEESRQLVGAGAKDAVIPEFSFQQKRMVLTHDRDFGALVFAARNPFYAILYLRPGHLSPIFTIESLKALLARDLEVTPPFIVVCERIGDDLTVRIRQPIP